MALRHFVTWVALSGFIFSMCSTSEARWWNNSKPTTQIEKNITWDHKGMLTHYGKKFVLAFITSSRSFEEIGVSEIFLHALENSTDVRVRIPCLLFDKKYSLMKEQVVRIKIPKEAGMTREAKIERKGVEISANKDIAVYALNKVNASSHGDGFLVYPRRALGFEYVATSYAGSHSNLGIVGVYNNTNVTIVLNQQARVTYAHPVYKRGETLRFSLNELQTFYVRSRHDLSGVRVITDKPVAVFSGATCALTERAPNCGPVVDQLPTVRTWGQQYIVYSGSHSMQGGVLRVTSATENTVVLLENGITAKLGVGQVVDFVIQSRTPTLISCSPYCMATLYNTHLSLTTCLGRGQNRCNAGPSMTNLPAVTQFLPYYNLFIPTSEHDSRFLNIVITCSATRGLVMNGVLLSDLPWKTSEGGTWCGVTIEVTKHGVNTLYHQDGTTFGVMVVVIGDQYSYTYVGGRSFKVDDGNKVPTAVTNKPTINAKANMAIQAKNTAEKESRKYKIATITMSVLCAIVLLALVLVLLRYKAKHLMKNIPAKDNTTVNTKPPIESEYQSIRGFPRRNTHPYEEVPVKPKLPSKTNRPAITDILLQSENGQDYKNDQDYENDEDYENEQDYGNSEDYENLKFKNRESNAYVPMDEALAGCAIAGSAIVLSTSGENDLYLTMKKLMTGPEAPQEQQEV